MADQNKVLIRLVYGADHSLSLDSQEYELAEEIRKDEREACIKLVCEGTSEPTHTKTLFILKKERKRIEDAIKARGTT